MIYIAYAFMTIVTIPCVAVMSMLVAATMLGAGANFYAGSVGLACIMFLAACTLCALQEIMSYRSLQNSYLEKRYLPDTLIISSARSMDGRKVASSRAVIWRNTLLSMTLQFLLGGAIIAIAHVLN